MEIGVKSMTETNLDVQIYQAIFKNDIDELKSIFKNNNIDIDKIDDEHYSLLDHAIVNNFEEGALFLIKAGICKLNDTQNDGWTIHLATEYGMISVIQEIIKEHKDCINLLDERNQTPIRIAAVNIRIEPDIYLPIFEILIKNGADPYIKNKFGRNAIDAFETFCDEEKNTINKLNEKYKFMP